MTFKQVDVQLQVTAIVNIEHLNTGKIGRLACDERFIGHGVTLDDSPIYWKLPTRNHFDDISSLHQINIHLLLTAAQIDVKHHKRSEFRLNPAQWSST